MMGWALGDGQASNEQGPANEHAQMLAALLAGQYQNAAGHANQEYALLLHQQNSANQYNVAQSASYLAKITGSLTNSIVAEVPRIAAREYVRAAILYAFEGWPDVEAGVGLGPWRLERAEPLDAFRADAGGQPSLNALVEALRAIARALNWLVGSIVGK